MERFVEILAAIDPPRSAQTSPQKGFRKLPGVNNNSQRNASSLVPRRERKTPKAPPPHDAPLAPGSEPGMHDVIGRRKSPRGSDIALALAQHPAETSPDSVGSGTKHAEDPVDQAPSRESARAPWHEWQQSNPGRKLPRVILKVREPGT